MVYFFKKTNVEPLIYLILYVFLQCFLYFLFFAFFDVFLNEGNYYLLIKNGSKGADYILRSAVSVFTDKDGTQYFFPLYDCQIFYNGMLFFDENRTTIKTDKSWQHLLDYFNLISDEYVSIDSDTTSAIISISTIDGQLVVNKKIKISYWSDGINHYLTAGLLLLNTE